MWSNLSCYQLKINCCIYVSSKPQVNYKKTKIYSRYRKDKENIMKVQFTLEQHRFELCRSIYSQIFFSKVNTTVLHNLQLTNPRIWNWRYRGTIDMVELPIQKANHKLYVDFWLHGVLSPLTTVLFNCIPLTWKTINSQTRIEKKEEKNKELQYG